MNVQHRNELLNAVRSKVHQDTEVDLIHLNWHQQEDGLWWAICGCVTVWYLDGGKVNYVQGNGDCGTYCPQ